MWPHPPITASSRLPPAEFLGELQRAPLAVIQVSFQYEHNLFTHLWAIYPNNIGEICRHFNAHALQEHRNGNGAHSTLMTSIIFLFSCFNLKAKIWLKNMTHIVAYADHLSQARQSHCHRALSAPAPTLSLLFLLPGQPKYQSSTQLLL